MKQHITVEQLNELSEKDKNKLRQFGLNHLEVGNLWVEYADYWEKLAHLSPNDLWINRLWDGDEGEEYSKDPREHELMWPLLSIGQMIEFLGKVEISRDGKNWDVYKTGKDELFNDVIFEKKELCDALWDAVKEELCHTLPA